MPGMIDVTGKKMLLQALRPNWNSKTVCNIFCCAANKRMGKTFPRVCAHCYHISLHFIAEMSDTTFERIIGTNIYSVIPEVFLCKGFELGERLIVVSEEERSINYRAGAVSR